MRNKYIYNIIPIFIISLLIINIDFCEDQIINDISSIQFGKNLNSILYVGGKNVGNYSSIQNAINDAKNGYTIYVYNDSSPYYENIVISKSLNIIGENLETTKIIGNGNEDVVYMTYDNISLSGFTIQNSIHNSGIRINSDNNKISSNIITGNKYGIRCDSANNNVISSNKIKDNDDMNICIYDSSKIYINENKIEDSYIGIKLYDNSYENDIYGNTIEKNDFGIYIENASNNKMYWNLIMNCIYGIYSFKSSELQIYNDNILSDNNYGIYLKMTTNSNIYDKNQILNNDYGVYIVECNDIFIFENIIDYNDFGILLNNSNNNEIYWNIISKNENGIYFYMSDNNNNYFNDIIQNYQFGLNIYYSHKLIFSYNNFIENNVPAYFIQEIFSLTKWKNNYWDDWNSNSPYRIYGEIKGIINIENWFNLDLRPSENPY